MHIFDLSRLPTMGVVLLVFRSTIDWSTISGLELAWTYELGVGAPTNPIVIGDTVFIADQGTSVHAIDLASGKARWLVPRSRPVFGPNGVAVGWGKVFSDDGGTALDHNSGDIVWSFDTIESDDLWGHPNVNSGGGAWYPPAIHGGTTYWGTSNPYPFPGVSGFPNGSSRPGDNRWTNSLLAIGLETGVLTWGHQVVPHDIFDYDSVIVAVAETDRGTVIVNSGKHGRILGFTPEGTLLWDTPVGMHQNDGVKTIDGEIRVLPGVVGGVITPIAIADGVIYATVVNAPDRTQGRLIWEYQASGGINGWPAVVGDYLLVPVGLGDSPHLLALKTSSS